tara:strand:+ start:208 stop:528 length:321 start_codon:yes stop_codon:yes gene_type:complete
MKRLLLPLLAALALPTAAYANYGNSARFNGKYQIVCNAFDKGYLTKDQKNELLIEAYIKYDDNFKGTKYHKKRAIREIFTSFGKKNRPECLSDLETYIKENIYPGL